MKTEVTQEPKQPEKKGKKSKVVNLTVHKNTLDKKIIKEKKQTFQDYFKAVQEVTPSPTEFAIVALDADNMAVAFICEQKADLFVFPEKVKQLLLREANKYMDICDPVEIEIDEE